MRKSTKVFWISFAVYSLLSFSGALLIEQNQNNLGFLYRMSRYIPIMKYYTFLGLIFIIVAFFSMWRNRVRHNKKTNRLEEEKRELKAAMFDLKQKREEVPQIKEDSDLPEPEE